ncbi:MAG: hypothetical protein ACI9AT_002044 [Ulvibacter sp.]|jgi:hypothetical protein
MKNDIFYNYHLGVAKRRRDEALELFNKCDYDSLRSSYIQYLVKSRKEAEISDLSLDGAIKQLTDIKNALPKNVANVAIAIRVEEGEGVFCSDEEIVYVSWIEYSIEDEAKCVSLAKHWAKASAWEMKYQPNGKKGKSALALHKKLISKTV